MTPGYAPAPPERTQSKAFARWLLVLVLSNLLARLPLCWDPVEVRNDGAEYLAIARSLRTTGRYATDLKYHFYNDDPVRHAAWGDRPPLYPAFAAVCQAALPHLNPTAAARLGSVLAACAALALCALYLRRVFGDFPALIAAGYVFLLPQTLYWTAQPMTEAVSLALTFGALLLSGAGFPACQSCAGSRGPGNPPAVRAKSASADYLGGLSIGLLYLARPTGVLLLAAILAAAVRTPGGLSSRNRPSAFRILLGFLVCALPYHVLLWRLYGSPFHSSLGYTFSVRNYYEVTYHGFERPMISTLEFLRLHGAEIPGLILRQARSHVPSLLGPLAGLLPLALFCRRADWTGPRLPAALFVILTAVAHTLVWSAWGSQRYFLPILPILAGALAAAWVREGGSGRGQGWKRALGPACLGATAVGLLVSLVSFYRQELRPDHGRPSSAAVRQAAAQLGGASLIASDRPATLNLLLERPAVMLPLTRDTAQLQRFVEKYRPDVMVLFVDEPLKDEARAMADHWRAGRLPPGWRAVEDQGSYVIAAAPGNPEDRCCRSAASRWHTLAGLGCERRNGCAWPGDWPAALLERDYAAWKAKQ